jgi:hypothetical protein
VYIKTGAVLNAEGSPAKGNPKRTTYLWATMRDTIGQTFFATPRGRETQEGLIYSHFHVLIKTPFDTSKVYVFDNESLENLALDTGYIRKRRHGQGILRPLWLLLDSSPRSVLGVYCSTDRTELFLDH